MADDAFDASNNERLSTDNLTAEDLTPLQAIDPTVEQKEGDPQSSGAKEGQIKMQVQSAAINAKPLIVRYKWTIENFSNVPDLACSGTFLARGYRWRILISGRGNPSGNLSMYLDFADAETRREWDVFAQFKLTVVNQRTSNRSIDRESQHQFNDKCRDWGFSSFMPMSDLFEPDKGYIIDDTLIVQAEVFVKETSLSGDYGCNRETGYVGLKNLGNTCYLNSAIQTLYHIPYLRSVVYHMPTTGSNNPGRNVPLALYNLFYGLEHSNTGVSTWHLIESLGWDHFDAYEQNDVQEFNKLLCATLQDKMKGTALDGTITGLFEGHVVYYIKCIHVEQQSVRMEPFLDLNLDVKGCPDIYASFDKYCEVERMEGDRKYETDKYGLQDAQRGCLFKDFPPVLFLHLKRFEFNFEKGLGFKIFDRYEYPMVLDLDKGNRKYLSSDSDKTIQNLFTLYSVSVHRGGGVQGGHYYAFIRPSLSNRWLKFDDERVTEVDAWSALDEQYGGEEELLPVNPGFKDTPFKVTKYSSAYMLVYVRDSDKDKIVAGVEEKDITERFRKRLKRDQGENVIPKDKKKVKTSSLDADQHTVIKVVQESSLKKCLEKNMDFELIDFERKYEYEKSTPFQVFKDDLAIDLNIGIQFMRLWRWDYDNHHISRSLSLQEEALTVGELHQSIHNLDNDALHLFVEYERGADQQPIPLKDKSDDDMLLLLMLYDPETIEIRYMGRLYVKASGSPFEFFSKLNQMAGFSPDEAIVLYKVEKSPSCRMCKSIDKDITFQSCEFHDGDIICYQKAPVEGSKEKILYPDFPSFLEYANNHRVVYFRLLGIPTVDIFWLKLSMLLSHDDVVARVAQKIKIDDHSKIRLTSHNHLLHKPMPQPIECSSIKHLSDMLRVGQDLSVTLPDTQKNDILYFEVLRTHPPWPSSINLLIMFRKSGDQAQLGHLTVSENSTVGDILNILRTKVSFQLSVPDAQLRLLQIRSYMIYKVLADDECVMNIDGSDERLKDEGFIAEEILEEEKNLGPNDVLVNVFHFFKNSDGLELFGEPFCLTVREGETLADIKPRIRMKLQISVHGYSKISADEFAKWGFACCSNYRLTYLRDSFLVAPFFKNFGAIRSTNQLGLEHEDPGTERSFSQLELAKR